MTNESITRPFVKREIYWAVDRKDKGEQLMILPIHLEEIIPNELDFLLGNIQALKKYKMEDAAFFDKLCKQLK